MYTDSTYTRGMSRFLVLSLSALLAICSLSSCRYNFFPIFPPVIELKLPVRIENVVLIRQNDKLILNAGMQGEFSPAYMKVSWFKGSRLLAEDSVYLDKENKKATFSLEAPQAGAYRAAISFDGVVLRQVELYEVEP